MKPMEWQFGLDQWWRLLDFSQGNVGHSVAMIIPTEQGWQVRILTPIALRVQKIDYPCMPIEELRTAVEVMVRMT